MCHEFFNKVCAHNVCIAPRHVRLQSLIRYFYKFSEHFAHNLMQNCNEFGILQYSASNFLQATNVAF